jgi:hypothetical protein
MALSAVVKFLANVNGIKYVKLIAWIVISCAYYALNHSVPYILSGVDQIIRPHIMTLSFLLIYISVLLYATHAIMSFIAHGGAKIRLALLVAAIAVLNLAVSIYTYTVDSYDMYLHINDERIIVNILILLGLTIELLRSEISKEDEK